MTSPPISASGAIVVLGDAPSLSVYLDNLRSQQVRIEFANRADDGVAAVVRRHPRTIAVLGVGYLASMQERAALLALRRAGAMLLSVEPRPELEADVTHNHLLPQTDVSWLVPEIYRVYEHTCDGRVAFARALMADTAADRVWLAHALIACPFRATVACLALGLSPRTLARRMTKHGKSWHELCNELLLEVCRHNSSRGVQKESAVLTELGCRTTTQLSRRLRDCGVAGWRSFKPKP